MIRYLLRTLLLIYFLVSAATVCAVTPQEAVDNFFTNPIVDTLHVAVMVRDLSSGEILASRNASTSLLPASIKKAVTTATLLSKAGKDWKFETSVFFDGAVRKNVLEGNLLVKASGDPSLNSKKRPFSSDFIEEIVTRISARGIDSIAGTICLDQSVFKGPPTPASWAPGDLKCSYGAGCFGLNFENNSSGKASVANPPALFSSRLITALRAKGIKVGTSEFPRSRSPHKIFSHFSSPLDEIMRECMMRSDNLFAEALFRTIPIFDHLESTLENASQSEEKFWHKKKANLDGVKIVDGSGLSRSNRVTARFMTDVLTQMAHNPYYASFFPLAGREGTLRRLLAGTPLEEYLAMKTGSMNGVQCYAGYKLDDDYAPTHTVVIIVNELRGSRDQLKKAVEKMLLEIFPQ